MLGKLAYRTRADVIADLSTEDEANQRIPATGPPGTAEDDALSETSELTDLDDLEK